MILPNVATFSNYGGPKINDSPIADPQTDEDADERNDYVEDISGMTQTAVRAWRRFVGHGTTPTEPASNGHGAVWGNTAALLPACTRSSTGIYVVTWPTTVTDATGTVRTVSIRGVGLPNVEGSTLFHTSATVTSANSITVRIYNTSNSLNDAVGATINVFAW